MRSLAKSSAPFCTQEIIAAKKAKAEERLIKKAKVEANKEKRAVDVTSLAAAAGVAGEASDTAGAAAEPSAAAAPAAPAAVPDAPAPTSSASPSEENDAKKVGGSRTCARVQAEGRLWSSPYVYRAAFVRTTWYLSDAAVFCDTYSFLTPVLPRWWMERKALSIILSGVSVTVHVFFYILLITTTTIHPATDVKSVRREGF